MRSCPYDPDNLRTLIVDGDPAICRSLTVMLESAGFAPEPHSNPRRLLETMNGQRYPLAFIDLSLPNDSGFELATQLIQQGRLEDIIFMGDVASVDTVVRAMQLGASDYLRKPIEFNDLKILISRLKNRRRLKEHIHRAEQRHSLLLQNIPLIIYAIREDLSLEFINQSVTQFLGYTPDEAVGDRSWLTYRIHPEDRRPVRSALRKAFKEGASFSVECRLIHKKGRIVHGIARSIPQLPCDPAAPQGVATGETPAVVEGIFMDITDRVFLEQALVQSAKLKTLGAISAEVAHEIRNPLMSIAGFARRLEKKSPAPELGIILREAQRLEQLVDRIRDYMKPVAISREGCSVNHLLSNAAALLSPELDALGVVCDFELESTLPYALADPDALGQVFIDLLRHAAATTAKGDVIRVRTAANEKSVTAQMSYPAHGPALDPEKLFMPFEEAEEPRGLPMCYRLVKNMGGLLEFQQTQGKRPRASFVITLPQAEDSRESLSEQRVPSSRTPLETSLDPTDSLDAGHREMDRSTSQQMFCFEPQSGVITRSLFDDIFARTLREAARSRRAVGLLLIDIDHFREFKERVGEERAVTCLNHVADSMDQALRRRPCALLARYGVQEYAVILPDVGEDEAVAVADALRRAVQELRLMEMDGPTEAVCLLTASVGVALMRPEAAVAAEELIAEASRALFSAKQHGRNRVRLAAE